MNTQKGFTHAFLILALVFLVGFALSFVFLQNFTKQQPVSSSSKMVPSVKPREVAYKTYTSISTSGLTFDYPETWTFDPPAKQTVSREDRKATILMLTSQKATDVKGKPEITSEHMCVTFNEMQGAWSFGSKALNNADLVAEFTVGQSEVSLMENKSNLASSVSPAMLLQNQETAGTHGAAYIALKDNYYLLATASKNCFFKDDLNKRDVTEEIEQAKAILKSVRIAN